MKKYMETTNQTIASRLSEIYKFAIVHNLATDKQSFSALIGISASTFSRYLSGKKILMVTGVLADKDTESILKEFTAITDFFIATEPENPRKLDSDILKHQIETLGAKCEGVSDCRKAVKAAAEEARRESFDCGTFRVRKVDTCSLYQWTGALFLYRRNDRYA